jgi:chromosome segregation ATPase
LIQSAMAFALGLFVAGLIVLIVTPAIWQRAMRLARRRIEASVPLTRTEIQADKDQLRAGFAVANRRLEIEAGRLRERVAEGQIALSRRTEEVAALSRDKQSLGQSITALEARIAALAGSLEQTEARLAERTSEVAGRDARLAEQVTVLSALRTDFATAQLMSEELRLEMVARQTEIANLSDKVTERTAAEAAAAGARDRIAADLSAERQQIAATRERITILEASLSVLQTERVGRLADLERRTTELRALEAEIAGERSKRATLETEVDGIRADRARLVAELAERGNEIARLTSELGDAARRQDALAAELDGGAVGLEGDNLRKALAATEAEKDELGRRLAAAEDDLDALRAENIELRRVAGAEWESDREENRRLRERLNEIAAGVVRLTQSLEADGDAAKSQSEHGTVTPIPLPSAPRTAAASAAEASDPTLAERLRALQHVARH